MQILDKLYYAHWWFLSLTANAISIFIESRKKSKVEVFFQFFFNKAHHNSFIPLIYRLFSSVTITYTHIHTKNWQLACASTKIVYCAWRNKKFNKQWYSINIRKTNFLANEKEEWRRKTIFCPSFSFLYLYSNKFNCTTLRYKVDIIMNIHIHIIHGVYACLLIEFWKKR